MKQRPSLIAQHNKPRPNLGTPYQVYTELISTGQNISGTKKRIKWRFGWSDDESEHEIELKHSFMSGKKTIYEDGIEITSVSSVLASEFNHGWNSENCAHIFRIEATFGIASETLYNFSIDGVSYLDMPRSKPVKSDSNPRASFTTAIDENRRSLVSRPTSVANNPRDSFISKPRESLSAPIQKDLFDPFDSTVSSSNTFDPFGPETVTSPKSSSPPNKSSKSPSLVDSFDSNTPVSTASFDPFGPVASSRNATSDASAFKVPFDVFGDGSNGQSSFSSPSNSNFVASQPSSTVASPDLFFAPPQQTKPSRRQSAIEIASDFTGMSFTSATVLPTPKTEPAFEATTEDKVSTALKAPEGSTDPWLTSSLVNLDLGKGQVKTPASGTNVRSSVRMSIGGGPSVGSKEAINPFDFPPSSQSSSGQNGVGGNVNKSFAISTMQPASNTTGRTSVPTNPYSKDAFSGLTGIAAPISAPIRGSEPLGASANPRSSINYGSGMQANVFGGPSPVMGASNRSSISLQPGINVFNMNPNQAPQSSLDKFEWRS